MGTWARALTTAAVFGAGIGVGMESLGEPTVYGPPGAAFVAAFPGPVTPKVSRMPGSGPAGALRYEYAGRRGAKRLSVRVIELEPRRQRPPSPLRTGR